MAATFALSISDVPVPTNGTDTVANLKSIIELAAPTNQSFRVVAGDMTFDSVTASGKPVLVQLIRATAAATGAATGTITPEPVNTDGAAQSSILTTANLKYWNSGAATEGTVPAVNGWKQWRIPPTSGLTYQWPLGREIWVPKGAFFRVRMVAFANVNVTVNIEVEE